MRTNPLVFQNSAEPAFVQISAEIAFFTSWFLLDPESHSSQGTL
jgi:hypothetical protein